jgi:hypothetical protein
VQICVETVQLDERSELVPPKVIFLLGLVGSWVRKVSPT